MAYHISIHPYYQPIWCSYFLSGLIEIYGHQRIQITERGFDTDIEDRSAQNESGYLHFIVHGPRQVKYVIDTMDTPAIQLQYLEWCDVYGKVNYDAAQIPENLRHKVLAVSPHVPVRHLSYLQSLQWAFQSFRWQMKSPLGHFKKHLKYPFAYQRLEEYVPVAGEKNYVFMNSALWKNNTDTNDIRANFMKAASAVDGVTFEGGFIDRPDLTYYPEWRTQKLDKATYLSKLRRSAVVFTNASVLGAHSFRICEYLAMGKAIVSPPFIRELMHPLTHGENIHFASPDEDSLREAISRINGDDAYRRKLETGARRYFEEKCRPGKLMQSFLDFGQKIG